MSILPPKSNNLQPADTEPSALSPGSPEFANGGTYPQPSKPQRYGPFELSNTGLRKRHKGEGDDEEIWERISAHFDIIANLSKPDGNGYSLLLRWLDDRGREHKQLVALQELSRSPRDVVGRLIDGGLDIDDQDHLKDFVEYLRLRGPWAPKAHLADQTGWFIGSEDQTNCFVLPDEVIGRAGDGTQVLFGLDGELKDGHYKTRGTLEAWREHVSKKCVGNSRLVTSVSLSFVGPLLRLRPGAESGGLHLRGASSLGKTTAQKVAGSVIGGGGPKGFCLTWDATKTGLELQAKAHNDCTLILDEIQKVEPKDVANCVYMLCDDVGKARSNANIQCRRTNTWKITLLSTGEMGMEDHAASAGVKIKGGAMVRMMDIEADAGCGTGLFEDLHGATSAQEFADDLTTNAVAYYGTAFRAYVEKLCQFGDPDSLLALVYDYEEEFRAQVNMGGCSPEVGRAASRCALIAAAGELAAEFGVTGWPPGEAIKQVARVFQGWLKARGGKTAAHDQENAIAQLRLFIEKHGGNRFERLAERVGVAQTDQNQAEPISPFPVRDRAGFLRRDPTDTKKEQYLFLPESFKEVVKGFDYRSVLRALEARGWLRRQGRHLTIKTTTWRGFQKHVYCISSDILGEVPVDAPDDESEG